jgi:hypothetical protein
MSGGRICIDVVADATISGALDRAEIGISALIAMTS